jgi:hypothetical protein
MDNDKFIVLYKNIYANCQNIISNLTDKFMNMFTPEIVYERVDDDINENINIENPIFVFGRKYDQNIIQKKLETIPYFCYRSHFPIPLKNGATDDIGWGCMARTGQMMLCQTLCNVTQKHKNDIIPLFYDMPNAPFSIHNITDYGEKYHVPTGSWFNPTGIGYTLKNLIINNNETDKILHVIMGRDGCIYEDEIVENLNSKKQILILIPAMLGIEKINESYYGPLLKCFESRHNIGIIGGKPKQSFYFVGKQNDNIFYLDPHNVKKALLSPDDTENHFSFKHLFDIKEAFSRRFIYDNEDEIMNYINIGELDPCMLICFLLKTHDDFSKWKEYVKNNININRDISLFSIMNKREIYSVSSRKENEESDEEWAEI